MKIPLLEGVQQPKKSSKTPGNAFSDALLMSRFQKKLADAAKGKKPCSARFFETARSAVLINLLILEIKLIQAKDSEKLFYSLCNSSLFFFFLALFLFFALYCLRRKFVHIYAMSTLTPTLVQCSYPLYLVMLTPCLNLYTRLPLTLGPTCGVSRCAATTHLLPCFLFALAVLMFCESSVHVQSRSLSFQRVCLQSAATEES